MRGFVKGFKYIDPFDLFLIGGWSVCGVLAGFVGTVIMAAFHV